MRFKKAIIFIWFLPLITPGFLFPQFILPEDAYTTHRDKDVVRIDNEKIEVKDLRARKSVGRMGEVELSWTPVDKKSQLAVVRNDRSIANLTALQTAKVVTLLNPGTASYVDTVINPGDYYYAVITYQNLNDQTAILKSNDNYTESAVHFGPKDLPANTQVVNEYVYNISAEVIDKRSVRIKWSYDYIENVSLLVYRSAFPVTDETKLKSALRLGSVPSSKNYFDDVDGISGDFYYAVMVQDPFGIEKMIFKENQNYTKDPLKKPEVMSLPVESLKGAKYGSDVIVTWYDPQPQLTNEYIVYRSLQPIKNETDIQSAAIVERVPKNNFKFIDKGIPDGEFYFAVLTQNSQGTVQKSILPGQNSLTKPIQVVKNGKDIPKEIEKDRNLPSIEDEVEPADNSAYIYDVHAVAERNTIHISWKPEKKFFEKISRESSFFHLFRFVKKPLDLNELTPGNYIAKIPIVNDSYFDTPVKDGLYYYAVFVTTPKGLLPSKLRFGDNLVGPVLYKKTVRTVSGQETTGKKYDQMPEKDFGYFDESSNLESIKLNNLLRSTFLQKRYAEAIMELDKFRRSSSTGLRAKANFYTAISNYYTGNYEEALNFLMDSTVRMVYKERADFWYKQILEKMSP